MGLWNVFYANWQMECCGTPFSVGDEVSWPLLLDDGYDDWTNELSKIAGPVEVLRDEEDGEDGEGDGGVIRALRTDDGVTAALNGDLADGSGLDPDQWVRRVGLLTVERHSAEWPETVGRVRAIHLVHQVYEETGPGSRSFRQVPGERSLEAVDNCPKWFGRDDDVTRTATGAGRRRIQDGVLVELEVSGVAREVPEAEREAPEVELDVPGATPAEPGDRR